MKEEYAQLEVEKMDDVEDDLEDDDGEVFGEDKFGEDGFGDILVGREELEVGSTLMSQELEGLLEAQ